MITVQGAPGGKAILVCFGVLLQVRNQLVSFVSGHERIFEGYEGSQPTL
jgi:hypothetical protein